MLLEGSHVLITGASRGFGEALAVAFAQAGARLTLVARDRSLLSRVATRTAAAEYACDLGDLEGLPSLVQHIEDESGPVDVLVNNAGVAGIKAFLDSDLDEIENLLRVDLGSPIALTRLLLPGMVERGRGSIVMITSIASILSGPGMAGYCAAKAGLSQFSAALEMELRHAPIRLTLAQFANLRGGGMLEECTSAQAYPPTRDLFALIYRLHLTVDTPCTVAARRVVEAVRAERRRVRLPTRVSALFAVAGLPNVLSSQLLTLSRGRPAGPLAS